MKSNMTAKALRKLIILTGQAQFDGQAYYYPLWSMFALKQQSGPGWFVYTAMLLYDSPEEAMFEAIKVRCNL